jgi:hypothetical protein
VKAEIKETNENINPRGGVEINATPLTWLVEHYLLMSGY